MTKRSTSTHIHITVDGEDKEKIEFKDYESIKLSLLEHLKVHKDLQNKLITNQLDELSTTRIEAKEAIFSTKIAKDNPQRSLSEYLKLQKADVSEIKTLSENLKNLELKWESRDKSEVSKQLKRHLDTFTNLKNISYTEPKSSYHYLLKSHDKNRALAESTSSISKELIRKTYLSFNIKPSNSYQNHLKNSYQHLSSAHALKGDWDKISVDIFKSFIEAIKKESKLNEQ